MVAQPTHCGGERKSPPPVDRKPREGNWMERGKTVQGHTLSKPLLPWRLCLLLFHILSMVML